MELRSHAPRRARAGRRLRKVGFHVLTAPQNTMFANNLRGPERRKTVPYARRCRSVRRAQKRNKNALKHCAFTKKAIEERTHVQALIGETRRLLRDIE